MSQKFMFESSKEVSVVNSASFLFVQEKALSVFRLAYDKAVALGYKLDIIFYQIRIGLFYLDNDLITRSIDKAKM